jgi:hypothetical protein
MGQNKRPWFMATAKNHDLPKFVALPATECQLATTAPRGGLVLKKYNRNYIVLNK